MRRWSSVFALVAGFALAAAGMCPAGAAEKGVTDDEIVIGCIAPLTGKIAMVGTAIANGAKDYFDYINEQGGINGRKIKFISEDGKYEPPTAIASFKKLITRDKIFGLISTSGTPITAALAPSIKREKIPSFCTIAASSIFDPDTPEPEYIFSFGPYYSENMIFNIEYVLFTLGAKKPRIALLYQDDEFGLEGKLGFDAAVEKYGLDVVAVEKYSRSAIELSAQAHNIKAADPDYVFMTTIPSHSIMFLKEAMKIGLTVPVLAVANTRFEQVIEVAGDAAANFYVTEYTALPGETGAPSMEKLMELWTKKNPPGSLPARYYILSHVNAIIMAEAIKRCGEDLTREKLLDTLESMKDFDTGGITGDITYSANDHCPLSAMRIVKADPKTVKYEPVTEWGLPKLQVR